MVVMAILGRLGVCSDQLQVASIVFLTSIVIMAVVDWSVRVFWVFKHILRMELVELRLVDSH